METEPDQIEEDEQDEPDEPVEPPTPPPGSVVRAAGGSQSFGATRDISQPDTTVDYDVGSAHSITVYWFFKDGASGTHRLNIRRGRPGAQVFFLGRNESGEPQTIAGDGLYWLPAGGAGLQFTTEVHGWMAANGAIIEDEQVGVACVLAVTA